MASLQANTFGTTGGGWIYIGKSENRSPEFQHSLHVNQGVTIKTMDFLVPKNQESFS